MENLIEVSGSKLKLNLHNGQTRAYESKARYPVIIAGTQSGKTSFGPWWLWKEIENCGVGDYLAVTATFDLFKLKMKPELDRVFLGYLRGWNYSASQKVLAKGGTRIILRSADSEGGLEAATAKAAWFDECGQDRVRVSSWEAIQRRLSLERGRCLLSTTPYNFGWLKTDVYDRWIRGDPDFEVINFKSTMNPRFSQAEYDNMKKKLPAWKFSMFYDGEFKRPAGMIYGDFDFETQVIDPIALNPSWQRFVGIDFGPVHTALIWLCYDPGKDVFYIYRESIEGGLTTPEHVNKALDLAKNENVIRWVGGAPSEKQERWDWQSAGINVLQPPISEVEAGISRVIEAIKTKRLFVFRNCVMTIDEVGAYSRKLDEHGNPIDEIKDKEIFHLLDALRYDISTLFDAPEDVIITYDNRVDISPY